MNNRNQPPTAAVIGGGPAGLMAADMLSQGGIDVKLFDAMPSTGRKFLMAGKGGLNISHSEPYERFLSRYGDRKGRIKPFLDRFGPDDLRAWVESFGIATFIGSSGRVFPANMKAAPLLRAWLNRLRRNGVEFHMRHRWSGWVEGDDHGLRFITPSGEHCVQCQAVVLALGGASWPQLGSDGAWAGLLEQRNVVIESFRPSNCGFQVGWSEHFRNRFAGEPLKSVTVKFITDQKEEINRQGEFIITREGIEGGLIYGLSSVLRDTIASCGEAVIQLDLMPDRTLDVLMDRLSQPRGKLSRANVLRKRLGIQGVKAALLRERLPDSDLRDTARLCNAIKSLRLRLTAPCPVDQAISCAGGVPFEILDEQLMIRSLPGVFCAGEMLDWEAPTGGYLLSACFATGRAAGLGALEWLDSESSRRPVPFRDPPAPAG
ncbi:MAG: TIGR03862 family flavoprotein [Gammaproteobacteria bacterium]